MVLITYIACASFHASREAYVAVKAEFQRHLHFPTQLLGLLDTTFLVCVRRRPAVQRLDRRALRQQDGRDRGSRGHGRDHRRFGALAAGALSSELRVDEAWAQGLSLYVPLVGAQRRGAEPRLPKLRRGHERLGRPNQRGLILGLWSTTGAAGDIIGLNVATAVLEGVSSGRRRSSSSSSGTSE